MNLYAALDVAFGHFSLGKRQGHQTPLALGFSGVGCRFWDQRPHIQIFRARQTARSNAVRIRRPIRNNHAVSHPAPERPDYLSAEVLAWADARHDSLELVAEEFLRVGEWPSITALERKLGPELAHEDEPVSLSMIMQGMPKPLALSFPAGAAVAA